MKKSLSLVVICLILGMFPILGLSVPESDTEIEPNDTKDEATQIHILRFYGNVGLEGDTVDWFFIPQIKGEYVEIHFEKEPEDAPIDFEVYSYYDLVGVIRLTDTDQMLDTQMPGKCYIRVSSESESGDYYRITVNVPVDNDPIAGWPAFSCGL